MVSRDWSVSFPDASWKKQVQKGLQSALSSHCSDNGVISLKIILHLNSGVDVSYMNICPVFILVMGLIIPLGKKRPVHTVLVNFKLS